MALQADNELWELLQTPLMLSIVALTYAGRRVTALQRPGTLEERRQRLFAEYIEHMFERRPLTGRYTKQQATHWLAWLAQSMHTQSLTEFHLDRLQPDWLPTKAQQILVTLAPAVAVGLTFGLVFGLSMALFVDSLGAGLFIGLLVMLFTVVLAGTISEPGIKPIEEVHWSWPLARSQAGGHSQILILVLAVIAVLLMGLMFEPVFSLGLARWLGAGLVSGLLLCLYVVLASGLTTSLVERRATPNEGIRRSARYALMIGLGAGLFFALVIGLFVGLFVGLFPGLVSGLFAWLVLGLFFGLTVGGYASLKYLAVRALLVYNRATPRWYIRFLNDATERLLLRRRGSAYLFTHRLLLEQFAGLGTEQRRQAMNIG